MPSRKRKARVSPVVRLMAAMDRCALARGEAQWVNGYRAHYEGCLTLQSGREAVERDAETHRLRVKENQQWARVTLAEAAFKRLAQRIPRKAR